jgi:BASS family bile acid:Na+ symporter
MFAWFRDWDYTLTCAQLVFFMIGMGAKLEPAEFIKVVHQPRSLLYGLAYQIAFVPFLAVLFNHVAGLEASIALGLILVALMPGGSISKVFAHLGGGNVALTIVLSGISTLAAIVTVPLLLELLASAYVPENFAMPLDRVVYEVALFLILPLLVGMLLARLFPVRRRSLSRWCVRIGWGFLIVVVVASLGSGRIQPGEYGWKVPAVIILFCIVAQQASMLPYYLLNWPRPDRLAIGIEVTMRNMNLALLLMLNFPEERRAGLLFVILFYAAVAMFAGVPLTLNHLRLARQETAQDRLRLSDASER